VTAAVTLHSANGRATCRRARSPTRASVSERPLQRPDTQDFAQRRHSAKLPRRPHGDELRATCLRCLAVRHLCSRAFIQPLSVRPRLCAATPWLAEHADGACCAIDESPPAAVSLWSTDASGRTPSRTRTPARSLALAQAVPATSAVTGATPVAVTIASTSLARGSA